MLTCRKKLPPRYSTIHVLHRGVFIECFDRGFVYLQASSTATATATVAPTIGLLPMPRKPIIST